MSIIFASIVGIIFVFYPMIMAFYHNASKDIKILVSVLCIISVFFVTIPTFIAFIIACIGIGFKNSIKSILFAAFLAIITVVFMAAELAAFIALIGSTI